MANRINSLRPGTFSTHRIVAGAPIVADPAVSASFPDRLGLVSCLGYQTLVIGMLLAGGVAPTVNVEILAFDEDKDGFFVLDEITGMATGDTAIVDVYAGRVFVRIGAVAGNPTDCEIRAMPGAPSATC